MDLSKDVKVDGAEMREEGSGEVVNGNQIGNEQLSNAGKAKATPPPSSLKILGGYDKKAVHKVTT